MKRLEEWLRGDSTRTVEHAKHLKSTDELRVRLEDGNGIIYYGYGPTIEAAINAAIDAAEGVKR